MSENKKPRWTEQDKEAAKVLKRMIAAAHHVWRAGEKNVTHLYDEDGDYIATLGYCFAALPPRTDVTLDEIIGGAE